MGILESTPEKPQNVKATESGKGGKQIQTSSRPAVVSTIVTSVCVCVCLFLNLGFLKSLKILCLLQKIDS